METNWRNSDRAIIGFILHVFAFSTAASYIGNKYSSIHFGLVNCSRIFSLLVESVGVVHTVGTSRCWARVCVITSKILRYTYVMSHEMALYVIMILFRSLLLLCR